jgi:sulfoxide reductase heme-binding subunit YedZ
MTARRVARHLAIGATTAAAGALLYVLIPSANTIRKVTLATAYPGMALLAATLCIGPWYVLRGRRPPVSVGWRRDLGIWAGALALVHTVVGLRVHFRGEWRHYFVYPAGETHVLPFRVDAIGWANHAGAVAMVLVTGLVALSNDAALRGLGATRWKSLQRVNYAVFGLAAVHGFLYQVLTRRPLPVLAIAAVLVSGVVIVQALGFRARRRARRVPG